MCHTLEVRHLIREIGVEPEDPAHAVMTKAGRKLIQIGDLTVIYELLPILRGHNDNSNRKEMALMTIYGLVRKHYGIGDTLDKNSANGIQYQEWLRNMSGISFFQVDEQEKVDKFCDNVEIWLRTHHNK